jgi:hypothetical protein
VDDARREDELQAGVAGLEFVQLLGEEGAVGRGEPGRRVDARGGVGERVQGREVQVLGGGKAVQPGQDRGDLGGGRELVAVVGDGIPECDDLPVGDDGLVDVDDADRGVIGRLQPSGDGDAALDGDDVGVRAGDPDDHRSLEVVNRVGTQSEETGTVRIEADIGAALL